MIDTIFQYGEDALNNESTIHIDIGSLGGNLGSYVESGALDFRATEFSVPEREIATYDQTYKGFTIQRWKPGTESDRTVSITFRVDKYWRVYRFLASWQQAISDLEGDGSYFPDSSDNSILRTTMTIQQLARVTDINGVRSEEIVAPGWVFTGVWPRSLPSVSFDNTSAGEAVTIEVAFAFLNMSRGSDQ